MKPVIIGVKCSICNIIIDKYYSKDRCQTCYKKGRQAQAPKIECGCGCGELIPNITFNNKPMKFKHGHGNFGEKNNFWKGGEKLDNGYKTIIVRGKHPNKRKDNTILQHRLIISNFLGRPLEKGELVHHKDSDKIGNRVENLELVTRKTHPSQHRRNTGNEFCSDPKCPHPTKTLFRRNCFEWYKDGKGGHLCNNCYRRKLRRMKQ